MKPFAGWENFYVITGSSAGALIGLQFVVMTLLASLPARRGNAQAGGAYATPTVVHFGAVLLLAGIMTVPPCLLRHDQKPGEKGRTDHRSRCQRQRSRLRGQDRRNAARVDQGQDGEIRTAPRGSDGVTSTAVVNLSAGFETPLNPAFLLRGIVTLKSYVYPNDDATPRRASRFCVGGLSVIV